MLREPRQERPLECAHLRITCLIGHSLHVSYEFAIAKQLSLATTLHRLFIRCRGGGAATPSLDAHTIAQGSHGPPKRTRWPTRALRPSGIT